MDLRSFLTGALLVAAASSQDPTPQWTTLPAPTQGIQSMENLTTVAPPLAKKRPALGASCNENDECQAEESSCKQSSCTCNEGFIASKFNPKCLEVVKNIGSNCYESQQCHVGLGSLGPTICLNFKCSCDIGWALVNGTCTEPEELDTVCNTTDDCYIKDSFCSNNLCTCIANYLPSSDNSACVKMLRLKSEGDPCSENRDCQYSLGKYARCDRDVENGRCKCGGGYNPDDGMCKPLNTASISSVSLLLLGFMFLLAKVGR